MTVPTPARRAELLAAATTHSLFADLGIVRAEELAYFLAATEPLPDGEVARTIQDLRLCRLVSLGDLEWVMLKAADLLKRLARQAREAEALVQTLHDIAEEKVVK